MSLVGTRCRNEGTVGFIGAIVALFFAVFASARSILDSIGQYLLSDWIGCLVPSSLAITYGYGEVDGSMYTDPELAPLIAGPLVVSLLLTLGLATWFTRWYGCRVDASAQPAKPRRRWLPRVALPALLSRFRFRWPGRWAALTWLNARQSVPLCLAGLTIAVLIALMSIGESQGNGTVRDRLAGELPSTTWFVGILWSAVVAVGIFSSELKPSLEQFWRSRPISPGTWFWMKFTVGLVAVVGSLDVIPIMLAVNVPDAPMTSDRRVGFLSFLACMPLIHAFVYSVAVAAVCRMRRAIPAAMIALLVFYVFDDVLKSIPGIAKLSTLDVYNRLEQVERAGEWINLLSEGYPVVYGIVIAVILGATLFARRTLIPPRAAKRVVLPSVLLGLCCTLCPNESHAAELLTPSDLIARMKEREQVVHDVRMRLATKQHRTAAFFAVAEPSRRRRVLTPTLPETESNIFELSERLPLRAWTEFGSDGAIKNRTAYDGTLLRQFTAGSNILGTRMAYAETPHLPFLAPDTALTSSGGTSLTLLLSEFVSDEQDPKRITITERDEDGEQLIDIAFTRTLNATTAIAAIRVGHRSTNDHRYQVTLNATRHYWPTRVQMEVSETGKHPISRTEIKAEGWIDAGPLVYPRKVEQSNYLIVPPNKAATSTPHSNSSDNSVTPPKLELVITQEAELLEIAVNTDLSDAVFAPAFPIGAVVYDQRDRKHYEVDASGTEHLYQPKPKGLRGAVFVYHLIWITAAATCLLRRKVTF